MILAGQSGSEDVSPDAKNEASGLNGPDTKLSGEGNFLLMLAEELHCCLGLLVCSDSVVLLCHYSCVACHNSCVIQ